ncbi:unnamed protein product [Urochloa decumbens]|uniref:BHLH domain-containing protein n=1 Tax=Urochloa decumbens TaxID=240449 RepID=A0ABC8W4S3_9POAL
MDGCSSWLPFQSGGTGGHGAAASERSCDGSDLPISSQVEEQLQQIYFLMDMEEDHGHEEAPSPQSSAFRSYFSASPDETSSLMLESTNATTNSCYHTPEVSSLKMTLSPFTYGDDDRRYGHCYSNLDDTIPTPQQLTCQQAHQEQVQRKNGHGGAGAFMPYSRHLGTKKKPKPGYGGQRAIKTVISALARMHMVRLAQLRQCYQYQMEMPSVAPPPGSNSGNQLQHVLSERKRREKLNDSFKALRAVLPPAPKKDNKASILIRARDYVNTLKSRVSELEKKNRMLVEIESQRQYCNNGVDQDHVSDEEIEVNIGRATAEEISQELHLKIVVKSGCNAMDAVVGILECLKKIGDVRLAAVDTGSRTTTLTLQMKTRRCDDNFLKESVIKSVKGVMRSKIETA